MGVGLEAENYKNLSCLCDVSVKVGRRTTSRTGPTCTHGVMFTFSNESHQICHIHSLTRLFTCALATMLDFLVA